MRKKVKVKLAKGLLVDEEVELGAYVFRVFPGLAIHRTLVRKEEDEEEGGGEGWKFTNTWTVTHVASGKKVALARKKSEAIRICGKLKGLGLDWSLSEEELWRKVEEDTELRERLRRFRNVVTACFVEEGGSR